MVQQLEMDLARVQYHYGNECSSLIAGDCALVPGCTQCFLSWPVDDPQMFTSSDAKCRCKNWEHGSVKASRGISDH